MVECRNLSNLRTTIHSPYSALPESTSLWSLSPAVIMQQYLLSCPHNQLAYAIVRPDDSREYVNTCMYVSSFTQEEVLPLPCWR